MSQSDQGYESLERSLNESGVVTPLAELHGGLCGTMCVGGIAAAQRWLEECLDDWQLDEGDNVGAALRDLELGAWRSLSSAELNFEPLLPGDDQPLDSQVRALALWCHGFLTGLGFGGLKPRPIGEHSEAVEEITKDFAEISRAALAEDEEEGTEAGFALAELKEYVRVGAQLVFEEYGGRQLDGGSARIH